MSLEKRRHRTKRSASEGDASDGQPELLEMSPQQKRVRIENIPEVALLDAPIPMSDIPPPFTDQRSSSKISTSPPVQKPQEPLPIVNPKEPESVTIIRQLKSYLENCFLLPYEQSGEPINLELLSACVQTFSTHVARIRAQQDK